MTTTTNEMKVPVTMRALIQRINRKLAKQGEQLRRSRTERAKFECGDYFVVDLQHNACGHHDVDPEHLGRELGVLAEYECVVEEESARDR